MDLRASRNHRLRCASPSHGNGLHSRMAESGLRKPTRLSDYHGTGLPSRGLPLFCLTLSSILACRVVSHHTRYLPESAASRPAPAALTFRPDTVTVSTPPYCSSLTLLSLIGRFPMYLPVKREWPSAKLLHDLVPGERRLRVMSGLSHGAIDSPSFSFQALKKSSGSLKAMNPYFACSPVKRCNGDERMWER